MVDKVPKIRHTSTDEAEGLVIRIPAKRHILALIFLAFWLCGWLFGEVMVSGALFGDKSLAWPVRIFLIAWLSMWTWGGLSAIYTWLWQVKGCEVVTASSAFLSIRREIFGYGRIKKYDVAEIRNLRESPYRRRNSGEVAWLAFFYGSKTIRFGGSVEMDEAELILQKIVSRVPQLASQSREE